MGEGISYATKCLSRFVGARWNFFDKEKESMGDAFDLSSVFSGRREGTSAESKLSGGRSNLEEGGGWTFNSHHRTKTREEKNRIEGSRTRGSPIFCHRVS